MIQFKTPVMRLRKSFFFPIFALLSFSLFAQESFKETAKISLQNADSLFITHNLALLAEKCNVDAAKAQIIQAKLFTYPTININQNVYNMEHKTNGARE